MQVIRNVQKLRSLLKLSQKGKTLGFVPTMGALHAGHLSLIQQSIKENQLTVVSIFVNPTQFGPSEDLKKYPRPLKRDLQFCRKLGVDFVFLPAREEMYLKDHATFVEIEGLSNLLCGASRPGHFRGVATVVTKLLNIVQPDLLYLGQKDAQQAIIIARLIKDLNSPVRLKVMPTVRAADGLALSSRNIYLNQAERKDAAVLFQSLRLAELLIKNGAQDTARIIDRMQKLIRQKKSARIDYIKIVDLRTLQPMQRITGDCLIVLAVWFGKARLIDNIFLHALKKTKGRIKDPWQNSNTFSLEGI